MSKIFISHSSKDDDFVRKLANSLTYDFGAEIWVDFKDNIGGIKWPTGIQNGLDECQIMLLIVSPDAIASRHVEDEWQNFISENKVLIPLLWKPIEKFPYQLKLIVRVDFHAQDYKLAFEELSNILQSKGIEPRLSNEVTLNKNKTANLFWLCHDLLELHRWLISDISKEWIDVGLRQSCHHLNEIGLKHPMVQHLEELRDQASSLKENEWTEQVRRHYANEIKTAFNIVAQEIQATDPNFNSGPG